LVRLVMRDVRYLQSEKEGMAVEPKYLLIVRFIVALHLLIALVASDFQAFQH